VPSAATLSIILGFVALKKGSRGVNILNWRKWRFPDAQRIAASQTVADVIGPWGRPELPSLPGGHTRFVMLAPGGVRFGQGPETALRTDRVAGTLLEVATRVLTALLTAADATRGFHADT
jgi:hypothetical protein